MVVIGDTIEHYGTPRHSGRYPWGSGEEPQRSRDILDDIAPLRSKGLTQKEQAQALGMTTTQLRSAIALANEDRKQVIAGRIKTLRDDGITSPSEIGRQLGMNESSVRTYISNMDKIKNSQLKGTVEVLKESLTEHPYLDVGKGTELQLGISRAKLNNAVAKLKDEGYTLHEIYIPQVSDPSKYTIAKVLSKESDISVVKQHKAEITSPNMQSDDGGLTYTKMHSPKVVDISRVGVVYGKADGTNDRDGLIQVRPGNPEFDLGTSHYAQVRVKLSNGTYMKGMAMYSDDLPKGVDLQFNTNKPKGTPKEKVFKELKSKTGDPSTQFGTTVVKQKGAFNIVNDEGDWNDWNGSKFSAQFLSKQPLNLIKDRIGATYKAKSKDLDDILKVTNPIVKKKLLDSYIETTNAQQKELKVMGLPNTKAHVLLPFPEMKANEIYAPNYKDGDRVVLIRYPHAGTFEIPELTVNNRSKVAKKALGDALDGVGIHPSVAHKLSGADFDGDVAYIIPNNHKQLKSTASLKGLENFDPNQYQVDHKTISSRAKQTQMGEVSNLITDMTIKGASTSELTRAVRHSMVVIDSEKHNLDWKKSARDNGIAALNKKYRNRESLSYDSATDSIVKGGRKYIGASTLISRSKSTVNVDYKTNPDGTPVYRKDASGNKVKVKASKTTRVPVINLVDDASMLSSGTAKEQAYVQYVNGLKKLSSKAQNASNHISNPVRSKEAANLYSKQVKSLETKLNIAEANAPRERRAQILANETIRSQRTPETSKDQLKKLKSRALADARARVGAKRTTVQFTDAEWEAVQKGAISSSMLNRLLNHADMDVVQQLATPRAKPVVTADKLSRAKTLLANGNSYADVASALGISASTLRDHVKTGNLRKE